MLVAAPVIFVCLRWTLSKLPSQPLYFVFPLCIRLGFAAAAAPAAAAVIRLHSLHPSSSACVCVRVRARILPGWGSGVVVWRSAPGLLRVLFPASRAEVDVLVG